MFLKKKKVSVIIQKKNYFDKKGYPQKTFSGLI